MSVSQYAQHASPKATPQDQPIPGSTQVANSAGGYGWKVDCWTQLDRFLILGCEGGSYYASERKMTLDSVSCVQECFAQDASRTINRIVEVSQQGLAPKNDPSIFALALLSNHPQALAVLPDVCRIGTHLLQFVDAATKFRGWGRSLKRAVAAWYNERPDNNLALQLAKYQNRAGWTHHDVLHKCHAKPETPAHSAAYRWAKDKVVMDDTPMLLELYNEMQTEEDVSKICKMIVDHRLPREFVPTHWLGNEKVWDALLKDMPLTAMIRNLGKMSSIGLLTPGCRATSTVCSKLQDTVSLHRSRVHPISILVAKSIYDAGCGLKGSLTWNTVSIIKDALDDAFYLAFKNVEPTGKRFLLALDVSGSMGWGNIAGTHLTPRVASAAMAMVTAKTESNYQAMAFCDQFVELGLSARQSLTDVIAMVSGLQFGGTDCSLPMQWALQHDAEVDVFIVYTDSETWCGRTMHPSQALQQYRQATGINAKLIVCSMTANGTSIADPNDAGMLDVVGFDTSVPQIIRGFAGQ